MKSYDLTYFAHESPATVETLAQEALRARSNTGDIGIIVIEDPCELHDARTGERVNMRYNHMTGFMENIED